MKSIFGADLTTVIKAHKSPVPIVVEKCIKEIEGRGNLHYFNTPMQYAVILTAEKVENFQTKNCDIFLVYSQNIDCGYSLEQAHCNGSNECSQSMF